MLEQLEKYVDVAKRSYTIGASADFRADLLLKEVLTLMVKGKLEDYKSKVKKLVDEITEEDIRRLLMLVGR